ncbi:hypothetical protein [Pseudonocardia alni]|uniref:hypothetical protein n=1 Tax=Pseudonocardia alni TaxID=33907 RepID=UPI0027A49638|nr:hypothetical protein PaSha_12765 [Pseudonocardia alni]
MTPYRQVSLSVLTTTFVGTTGTDPLGVDRDVPVDASGLPYVPRARMSARFRDAALSVGQAFPDLMPQLLDLFGVAGATGRNRMLSIGRAELPLVVRAAVADTVGAGPSPAAVTGACTVVRTTTAVDGDGAPVDGSLRTARGLAPGLRLLADLVWLREPEEAHLWALASCCLAFDQIGADESRGSGRVRCRLVPDHTVDLATAVVVR